MFLASELKCELLQIQRFNLLSIILTLFMTLASAALTKTNTMLSVFCCSMAAFDDTLSVI